MQIIFGFVYKYFFEAIAVFLVGMVTKYLMKQFGNDRTEKIKEAVLTAMLYAEEVFGLGHGDEKWTKAWQKIIDILKTQGITLSKKEVSSVTTLMKATVPEINSTIYSSLPEAVKSIRDISFRTVDAQKIINDLKLKHKVKKS